MDKGGILMSRGTNQKFKFTYLMKIMQEKTDDEHSELNVYVYVSPQFFGWIFGLGKDVKVVGPSKVVDEMREYARDFLENI